jgi:DNA repair exonuclease SbcCD ATPase subunit
VERLRAAAERKAAEPPPAPAPVAAAPAPGPAGDDAARLAAEKDRADKAEAKLAEVRKKAADLEKDLKASRGRLETEKRVYVVQKGELELAQDRYAELRRRHDALRKEHEELIDAVRQAAKQEARKSEPAAVATPAPEAAPEGTPGA